jgi:hypothetical protein
MCRAFKLSKESFPRRYCLVLRGYQFFCFVVRYISIVVTRLNWYSGYQGKTRFAREALWRICLGANPQGAQIDESKAVNFYHMIQGRIALFSVPLLFQELGQK